MRKIELVLYRETDGTVPLLDWFQGLDLKARSKCQVRLERLADLGHELRRPEADFLRDGIHELRTKNSKVNFRILYFFHGGGFVVVSHGFSKQSAKVPKREIDLAIRRKNSFANDPETHSYEEDY